MRYYYETDFVTSSRDAIPPPFQAPSSIYSYDNRHNRELVRPIYPEIARGWNEGLLIQFYVYKSGYVAQSTDSIWTLRGIPNGLDEAAINAIKKQVKPGSENKSWSMDYVPIALG